MLCWAGHSHSDLLLTFISFFLSFYSALSVSVSAVNRQFIEFKALLSIKLKLSSRPTPSAGRLRLRHLYAVQHQCDVANTQPSLYSNQRNYTRTITASHRRRRLQSVSSFTGPICSSPRAVVDARA